jgi:hypothetical protein
MQSEALPRPNISSAPPPPPAGADTGNSARRRPPRWALALAGLAVIAAIAAGVLLLTGGSDEPGLGDPHVVTPGELSDFADTAGGPVFWAGPAADGFKLELTEVRGDRVFVRYLSSDAKAGDPRPAFTTVATYPMQDSFAKLRGFSKREGAVLGKGAEGAATLYYKKSPSSVYVAQRDSDHLVEVYAPEPQAALQIASSASLVQVP